MRGADGGAWWRSRWALAGLPLAGAVLLLAAFALTRPTSDVPGSLVYVGQDATGDDQVYRLDMRDGKLTQLTDDTANKATPRWSPDGKQVAFVDLLDRISVMNWDGTGLRTLPAPGVLAMTWSPDGRQLLYQSSAEGDAQGSFQFRLINLDGSDDHPIRVSGQGPAWSPGGNWIAYSGGNGAIWLAHPDGSAARQLTHPKADEVDVQPRWSRNGRDLTFSRDGQIYTVSGQGGSVRLAYSDRGVVASGPAFTGGGTVAFEQCEITSTGALGGLYRIGTNGRGLTLVTSASYACTRASADWYPTDYG